jgi:putative salt-induced outer membrane protein
MSVLHVRNLKINSKEFFMSPRTRHLLIGFITLSLASAVFAEEAAQKPWKNEAELSVVSSNGNTRSDSSSGKDTFVYKWTKTTMELIAGGMGAKSSGQTIAERYFASEKLSYALSDRNYTYEKVAWDKDRFAGIKNRYDGTVGFGREVMKRTNDLMIAELGTGFTSEERYNQNSNDFQSGRAYVKYTRTLSPTANFSQDADYLQNFENPDDFRAKTETALTAALSSHFSLKLAYVWKHVGTPPTGFGRNDTITSVSLIATY